MQSKVIHNRYEVLEKLGEGGMGVVYKVRDDVRGEVVALKMLSKRASKSQAVLRFKREFRSLTELHHPNLAKVHDFGKTKQGNYYFTMEWVGGANLEEFSKMVPLLSLYPVIVQVCRALEFIHSRGMIHCDIKPSNILIQKPNAGSQEPIAKLMDFGLVGEVLSPQGPVLRGTVAYMAPEAIRGGRADRRADLYSFGVVLYEIITGKVPFRGETTASVLRQHIQQPPRPPREVNKRVPEGLESIILRLLAKEPADRYGSANEVIEAINKLTGSSFSLETRETRESYVLSGRFVGRAKELGQLKRVFGEVGKGGGHVVLVSGESGIGKTRLLQEFSFDAQLSGALVLAGGCLEHTGSPYQPFISILGQLVRLLERAKADSIAKYGSELVRLIPELRLRRYLKDVKAPPQLRPEEERLRLMDQVTQFICEAGSLVGAPLLLILEDLQWADEETVAMLDYVGRNSSESSILICGAYRSEEVAEGNPLKKMIERTKGQEYFTEISLGGLDEREVSSVLGSMLGREDLGERIGGVLHGETDGNPLFLEQLTRCLVEEGVVRPGREPVLLDRLREIGIPKTVKRVIEKRLRKLDGDSLRLLRLASVVGRGFDMEVLAALTGHDEGNLAQKLSGLERAHLLSEAGTHDGTRYGFLHEAIRQTLYSQIGEKQRKRLHQKVGEVLEQRWTGSEGEGLDELAYHFLNGLDKEKAVKYGLRAADRSKILYANERALETYNRVLGMLGHGELEERVSVLESMAQVQELVGQYGRAIGGYREILDIGSPRLSKEARASRLRKMGEVYERKGDYDEAVSALETAMSLLGETTGSAEAARTLIAMGFILLRKGEYHRTRALCLQALEISRRLGEKREMGFAYNVLGLASFRQGDFSQAVDCHQKSLTIRERTGAVKETATSLINLGIAFNSMGDYPRAIQYYEKSLRINEEIGHLQGVAYALNNLANVHYNRGDYSRAAQFYERSRRISERIGDQRAVGDSLSALGHIHYGQGDYSRALGYYEKSLEIAKRLGSESRIATSLNNLGNSFLGRGEYSRATGCFKESLKMKERVGSKYGKIASLLGLGVVYQHVRAFEEAEDCSAQALAIAQELGAKRELAYVHKLLGDWARLQNDWGAAEARFRQALQIFEELGDKSGICTALTGLAHLSSAEGRFDEAVEVSERAVGMAEELNSKELSGEVCLVRGAIEKRKGNEERALRWLRRALGFAAEMPELRWQIALAMGEIYERLGTISEALDSYHMCIEALKAIYGEIKDEDLRKSYLSDPERNKVFEHIRRLEKTLLIPTSSE